MRELGDKAFEVEWCSVLPRNKNGDAEPDLATYEFRVLDTYDAALAFAKSIYPKDQWGSVRITPVEFVDPFGDGIKRTFRWEPIGDSEFFEGK